MGQLILAAVIGVAVVVCTIVFLKLHPFLGLLFGSLATALIAGIPFTKSTESFVKGAADTFGDTGLIIVVGGMIGLILTETGAADVIVDTVTNLTPRKSLGWAMLAGGFAIGIALFFHVGVVIVLPLVMMVAKRTRLPIITLGGPALAGLSTLHALVPPHPGPLVAATSIHANIGITLILGLLVSIPIVVIAGPLLSKILVKWVPQMVSSDADLSVDKNSRENMPTLFSALAIILLPVLLMFIASAIQLSGFDKGHIVLSFIEWIGSPIMALLVTVIVGIIISVAELKWSMSHVNAAIVKSFSTIAGVVLVVCAGGGFKQTLIDTNIGKLIADSMMAMHLNIIVAAWLVAVLIRLATGSATVACVTAGGIIAPLVTQTNNIGLSLIVLAIGAGSLFFSHISDAGFWMVKEYLGLSVIDTFKTWSVMETVISILGLLIVLALYPLTLL
ncbi:GntT/GntP/DsdX family permease [Alloscardovia venturai]